MIAFLLKRFATFVATLAVASAVVFAVLELLPGNAAEVILGETATPESVAALQRKLGLDRPPLTRYLDWVGGLLHGRTADSISYGTPTAELIVERLQVTLPLAAMAMALTVVLALALGVYAASRHNRLGDVGVMAASQLGIAIPNFWFAILLILLFAVQLQWVNAGGFPGWSEEDGGGLWEGLKALVLPAVSLAVVQAAILARITASSIQPRPSAREAEARQPSATPTTRPMPTAMTPTRMLFCAPTSSCEAMSRPRLSVPSQCAALGGCSLFGMSISATG